MPHSNLLRQATYRLATQRRLSESDALIDDADVTPYMRRDTIHVTSSLDAPSVVTMQTTPVTSSTQQIPPSSVPLSSSPLIDIPSGHSSGPRSAPLLRRYSTSMSLFSRNSKPSPSPTAVSHADDLGYMSTPTLPHLPIENRPSTSRRGSKDDTLQVPEPTTPLDILPPRPAPFFYSRSVENTLESPAVPTDAKVSKGIKDFHHGHPKDSSTKTLKTPELQSPQVHNQQGQDKTDGWRKTIVKQKSTKSLRQFLGLSKPPSPQLPPDLPLPPLPSFEVIRALPPLPTTPIDESLTSVPTLPDLSFESGIGLGIDLDHPPYRPFFTPRSTLSSSTSLLRLPLPPPDLYLGALESPTDAPENGTSSPQGLNPAPRRIPHTTPAFGERGEYAPLARATPIIPSIWSSISIPSPSLSASHEPAGLHSGSTPPSTYQPVATRNMRNNAEGRRNPLGLRIHIDNSGNAGEYFILENTEDLIVDENESDSQSGTESLDDSIIALDWPMPPKRTLFISESGQGWHEVEPTIEYFPATSAATAAVSPRHRIQLEQNNPDGEEPQGCLASNDGRSMPASATSHTSPLSDDQVANIKACLNGGSDFLPFFISNSTIRPNAVMSLNMASQSDRTLRPTQSRTGLEASKSNSSTICLASSSPHGSVVLDSVVFALGCRTVPGSDIPLFVVMSSPNCETLAVAASDWKELVSFMSYHSDMLISSPTTLSMRARSIEVTVDEVRTAVQTACPREDADCRGRGCTGHEKHNHLELVMTIRLLDHDGAVIATQSPFRPTTRQQTPRSSKVASSPLNPIVNGLSPRRDGCTFDPCDGAEQERVTPSLQYSLKLPTTMGEILKQSRGGRVGEGVCF